MGNFDIVLAYYATYRMQADRASEDDTGRLLPKDRPHYGYQWVTSPLEETPIASRTIDAAHLPAFRQRVRLAFGLPGSVNYLIGAMMTGFRDQYLETYHKTWVTKGSDHLQSSLQGWHIVGVDVTAFDST